MAFPSAVTLGDPIVLPLSGKIIPNRLYRSAMSEYASVFDEKNREECGRPLPKYEKLYQDLADGGAGLICFGNIPIDRDFIENKGNAILDRANPWDPVRAFAPAIAAAKSKGAICLPQLQHPGRQCPQSINPSPKSSSDIKLEPCMNKTFGKPTALTKSEIEDIITRFSWAAEVLFNAGADGVILHASHGYLIDQFLSPKVNTRSDKYGGSLENRARFILEIVHSIKLRLPSHSFVIAVKFNCQDFIEGGFSLAESSVVMKWLEDAGVDFFDISGGTYENPVWRGVVTGDVNERVLRKVRGSYFIEWVREMKRVLSRAVIGTTGGWRDPEQMKISVKNGETDMCGLARPLMVQPGLVNKILCRDVGSSKL